VSWLISNKPSIKKAFLEGLEELKIDIFKDRIFVFTPQGDVIDLLKKAPVSILLMPSIPTSVIRAQGQK
jgi:(p)ppGpp synthase/HD superfamily hydrolase